MGFLAKLFGGNAGYDNIDANAYETDYFKKNNHILIDVRTKAEFNRGHIPGAKNYPLNTLANDLKRLSKDKPIIVVCQSGNRSRSGAKILVNAGFDNVINLKGGTMRWMLSGKPVKQ